MRPTLIIGLGGTGAHVIASTLTKLLESPSASKSAGGIFQFLYIDTNTYFAKEQKLNLPKGGIVRIGGVTIDKVLEHYCQHDDNLKKWFDCEKLAHALSLELGYRFPERFSLDVERWQYRQLGRLYLYHDLDKYSNVKASIHHKLLAIQQQTTTSPLVIICTSLIGGTGGAIALDVAYLVNHVLATINSNAHVLGVFALENIFASAFSNALEERRIKFILNQVAAIKEIQYFARTRYEFGPQNHVVNFDNFEPFDSYWLFGGDNTEKFKGNRPTDYFSLIASEISGAILSDDWLMQPKGCEYVNIQAPLITNMIGNWSHWEDIYNRHLKDPNRLCPHISREFCT